MPGIHPRPPSQSRAVIVGLEKYDVHVLHGPVCEAVQIARTLKLRGVDPERIDLWLAPGDTQSKALADASGIPWKQFDEREFIDFLHDTLATDALGGTLYFHWCGHGLSRRQGSRGVEHHLLLPASKATRLESVELQELTSHLVDERHSIFSHLVFVIDTCRESVRAWGDVELVPRNLGIKGRANGPLYCTLFVCPDGQTTTYTNAGSAHGPMLRTLLEQAPAGEWPDFQQSLQLAAGRLQLPTGAVASPYVHATNWFGESLLMSREPPKKEVFGTAPVAFQDQAKLASLSVRAGTPRPACADLTELLNWLSNAPATQGVSPLNEFAFRLLAASPEHAAKPLREWVASVSQSERVDIEKRIAAPPAGNVVMLWVDDDPDAALGQPAWRVMGALCDVTGTPLHLPDRPDFHRQDVAKDKSHLREVLHDRMMSLLYGCDWRKVQSNVPAGTVSLVELFLPATLVAEGVERESLEFEGETLDLADDYPTVLRNGRQPGTKHDLWRKRARAMLDRWAHARPLAQPLSADPVRPASAFLLEAGPVWCLVHDASTMRAQLEESHRICIAHGLPALAWACGSVPGGPQVLEARLENGLRCPPDEVASRLVALRRGGLSDLSLMFDDPTRPPAWMTRLGRTAI